MARITDREMYDYAISRGATPNLAAAMVANAKVESGLRHGVKGDRGTAIGLFQHRGSRRAGLQEFAKARGVTETDWKAQVDYALQELKTTEKRAMAAIGKAKTPEEAALAFSKHFERPNPQLAHNSRRQSYAADIHSRMASAPVSAGPPMAGAGLLAPEHVNAFPAMTEKQIAAMPQAATRSRDMGDLPMAQPVSVNMAGVDPAAKTGFMGLQNAMGRELSVNSAHRSPAKNRMVGGAKRSQHVTGKAFDISTRGMTEQEKLGLIEKASRQGFRGFGVGSNMIHVDMGPTRSWGYTRPSGGGKVPAWAAETVAKATSGAFMPTPTPRPEYTPPTAIAKAEPAPQALGFMGPVATTQALPEAQKQYAGSRVATGWTAAQTPPAPVSTSFGVMAPAGVQVLSPVQQTPPTIKGIEVAAPPPAATTPPPEQQAFTPFSRGAVRDVGRVMRGIPGAVRGAIGRMGMGQMQGPPQFAGVGLKAIENVRSGALGNAMARSGAGHMVGYDPNTGFTSITNNRGVTTYSKGDIQAAGPGSRGPFGNIGMRGAQAVGNALGRGARGAGVGLGGIGNRGQSGSSGFGLGGFLGGLFDRDDGNKGTGTGGAGRGGGGKGKK